MPSLRIVIVLSLVGLSSIAAAAPPITSWTGAGGDVLMSNAGNWSSGLPGVGVRMDFPASTAGAITQDIDALSVLSISFSGTGPGPYTITPGSQTTTTVTVGASGMSTVADLARPTLAFPIVLGAANTWTLASAITVSGDVDLGGFTLAVLSNDLTGSTLMSGAIKGTGTLTFNTTDGSVTLGGSAANTYSGNTSVNNGGTVTLDKPNGVVAIPGTVTVSSSTLAYGHDDQIADTARVNVYGSLGLLKLNGHKDTIGMLDPSGTVDLGAGGVLTLAGAQDMTLGGKILGDGASKIVFNGSASQFLTMSLNGTLWTGTLVVGGGTLQSAQNTSFDIVLGQNNVFTRGLLIGTHGAVTVNNNATILPGTFSVAGVVDTKNLSILAGGTYQARLGGPAAGSLGSDRINVTGTVTLAGTLSVSTTYTPTMGDVITLISNDGADPVVGTFTGLAEGAVFFVSGFSSGYWQISYAGGDGNDVTLTKVAAPPPDMATPPDMTAPRDMTPPDDLAPGADLTPPAVVDMGVTDDMTVVGPVDMAMPVEVDASAPDDMTMPTSSSSDMTSLSATGAGGCGCTVGGAPGTHGASWALGLAALAMLALLRRRARR